MLLTTSASSSESVTVPEKQTPCEVRATGRELRVPSYCTRCELHKPQASERRASTRFARPLPRTAPQPLIDHTAVTPNHLLCPHAELEVKHVLIVHPPELGDHLVDRLDAVLRVVARAHADGTVALLLRADDEDVVVLRKLRLCTYLVLRLASSCWC